MKSVMEMAIDTTWGNAVVLRVESELDNAHELSTEELTRLQVDTLTLMVAEVRRESERQVAFRLGVDRGSAAAERERFDRMERRRESDERVHDVRQSVERDEAIAREERRIEEERRHAQERRQ